MPTTTPSGRHRRRRLRPARWRHRGDPASRPRRRPGAGSGRAGGPGAGSPSTGCGSRGSSGSSAGWQQRRSAARRRRQSRAGGAQPRSAGIGGGARARRAGLRRRRCARARPDGVAPVGSVTFAGGSVSDADRVLAGLRARIRMLPDRAQRRPKHVGRVLVDATVAKNGEVVSTTVADNTRISSATASCMERACSAGDVPCPGQRREVPRPLHVLAARRDAGPTSTGGAFEAPPKVPASRPYDGPFKVVMDLLAAKDKNGALDEAKRWQAKASGDVMALVALGEALEAPGRARRRARLRLDPRALLVPRRLAPLRRRAARAARGPGRARARRRHVREGGRAAPRSSGEPSALRVRAPEGGPAREGLRRDRRGLEAHVSAGSLRGVDRILNEDLGLIAAAWMQAEPKRAAEIMRRLRTTRGGTEESDAEPPLRPRLGDRRERRRLPHLRRQGRPRVLRQPAAPVGRRALRRRHDGLRPRVLHHPRRARGSARTPTRCRRTTTRAARWATAWASSQVIEHDGKGDLSFEERPFVVMIDHAFVDLGTVERPKR